MLKVYDGVPVPEINRSPQGRRKFPVDTMTVGQMFFEPGRSSRAVSAYICRITKKLPGTFTTRHCWVIFTREGPIEVPKGTRGATEGTGIWRVA